MEQQQNGVVVVMVPLPAQGHLNQLLHLTRIISTRGIPVHYVGSATHNRQAKSRVHGWNPSTISNIHFHDFQLPDFRTPPPNPSDTNKFPSHLLPTFDAASLHLQEPLGVLLSSLCCTNRRVVVVYDSFMSFAAYEASLRSNAEAYFFNACAAFTMLQLEGIVRALTEGINLSPTEGTLSTDVPRISSEEYFGEGFSEYASRHVQWMDHRVGDLFNSCDAIEGRYIDMLAQKQVDKKLWAIGPFNPVTIDLAAGGTSHKCLEWLDKQPPSSVIYVSFGTMTSISDDQITELAVGLEHSGQKFIWVLRDADRGDIYKGEVRKPQLPDGYEERIKGIGIVVRDWAPQLLILAHPSTGGFMSHCGWNSIMESLSMGVPVAAWPMHSDQPGNALLITEVLKVGLVVREWTSRKELITSDRIESSIRKLMVSDDGNIMRKRAKELGVDIRQGVSDGGTSTKQLESFLAHISR